MTTKRSQPTPRNEGMANIIAATVRLLETKSPQDVTLRDVARESGHGHRLIVEWFGGKGGLYAAVVVEIFSNLMQTGELFYADVPVRREVRTAFQIFNYMQMHHPDIVSSVRNSFVIEALAERIESNSELSSRESRVAALRLSALTLGISIFGEFIGLSDDDAIRMMQDELKKSTGIDLPAYPPS